ncbi:MAG: hypothetical protein LBS34_01710, partial [Rickettsiales bacterium]|nr:hypothetical protein [Rickettsiales bacterium]
MGGVLRKLALVVVLCLAFGYGGYASSLSNEELLTIRDNGIVDGMCYVYDIITGRVSRAIMAVFVVASGWMFLVGVIKDWKPIFFFSLAITLVYGGTEIANIISGNSNSCNSLKLAMSIDASTIYNEGDCQVSEIVEYFPGQIWNKCAGSTCSSRMDSDVTINNNDEIALVTCQSGYLKDDDTVNLRYTCNANMNRFLLTQPSVPQQDSGKCKTACSVKDLNSVMRTSNAKSAVSSDTFSILSTSGARKGDYFTQGSIIDLDCAIGYDEYDTSGVMRADNGIKAKCITKIESDNSKTDEDTDNDLIEGKFYTEGSCKRKCNLGTILYGSSVGSWKKLPKGATDAWENVVEGTLFNDGDKVRIETCNNSREYFFRSSDVNAEDKMVLSCNNGTWKIDNENGAKCLRQCNIGSYAHYSSNVWSNNCPNAGDCLSPIGDKETFLEGDVVGVSGCSDTNYTILPGKEKKRITCKSDGHWNEDSGARCAQNCALNTIPSSINVKKWGVTDA